LEMNTESPRLSATLRLNGLEETARLGRRIAAALAPGDAVALRGDLGAGKTALARAILQSLGVTGPIASPTFTLVQTYETPRLFIRHYDLYRIEHESELEELGLDEALSEGAALIEWPERAGVRLPDDALNLSLTIIDAQSRLAALDGPARWASAFRDEPKDL